MIRSRDIACVSVEFAARGRTFTPRQLDRIAQIVRAYNSEGRTKISQRVCRALRWKQANGLLKDVACREVLRKLDALGLIKLPAPRSLGARWRTGTAAQYTGDTSAISSLTLDRSILRVASNRAETDLWNQLVQNYHYLGSSRIVGRQVKHLVFSETGRPIACLGWGDSCWALRPRDQWIGWAASRKQRARHLIVNNVRFLIPPWVKVKNLASYVLSRSAAAVRCEWEKKYGIAPVLAETFVDTTKFRGTCYSAAGWVRLGETAGYAKVGAGHHNSQEPKALFVRPLVRSFRQVLIGRR